uniref:TIR domain-containing protein n=2 Tax=Brassica TaxID=3705 RepID=A0A0D3DAK2_BRAOL
MFLGIYRGTCSSEYSEERCPSVYSERVFINVSIDGYMSKNASIDVYPDEVLLRYIPRRFQTNWCSSEFPRKCVSSEFRRMKKFRGIISEDLFRRPSRLLELPRGEQLRYSFASHLVDAFERHGINLFVDKYEQRGKDLENLFERIKESRIALAIFSTRYAESSWCMDELVKMKKLADKGKIQVIPIFYKVRARDVRRVRRQTGEFGDNFWSLAKASSGDQIKKWKEALECISGKMGLSLKDERCTLIAALKLILSRKLLIKEVVRVVAAARLKEVETRFEKKRRNDCNCPCQLPVIKRIKTEKL